MSSQDLSGDSELKRSPAITGHDVEFFQHSVEEVSVAFFIISIMKRHAVRSTGPSSELRTERSTLVLYVCADSGCSEGRQSLVFGPFGDGMTDGANDGAVASDCGLEKKGLASVMAHEWGFQNHAGCGFQVG